MTVPSAMPWVKLHTELLRDPRLYRLSESAQLHFFKLLMVAGQCDADGALQMAGVWLTCSEIAWHMNADADATCSSLDALAASGLLERSGDGWAVSGWLERQRTRQEDQRAQWRERQARARGKTDAEQKPERAKKPEKTAPEPVKEDVSREDKKPVTRDSRVSHAARERVRGRVEKSEVPSSTKGVPQNGKSGADAPPPNFEIAQAIARVCQMAFEVASVKGRCFKAAKDIAPLAPSVEQVDHFNRWARLNWWRCTKSNQLNPEDFAANWQQAMDWNGTVRMQSNGKPSGDTPESIAFREAMRRAAMGEQ